MKTSSVEKLVLKHFDDFQKGKRSSSIEARLALLEKEFDENEEDVLFQVTAAVLLVIDACMAAEEPSENILRLAACLSSRHGHLCKALVGRVVQFSAVIMERVRVQACKVLGMVVEYLMQVEEEADDDEDDWKNECLHVARQALAERLTDKSQAVRNAAIAACAYFFSNTQDELSEQDKDLVDSLLWNMAHDPSAANRIEALKSVPLTESTVDAMICRVRDTKVKVRVQALDEIRSNNNVELTSDQYAQVIRSGLTERCKATCEAATQLICAGWIKSVRYDPIALLDRLDPVLYENECSKVAQVVLDVAANANSSPALAQLSSPEIRAFQEGITNSKSIFVKGTYLKPSQVLFARVQCSHTKASTSLSEARKQDIIGTIVPDIPILCEALQLHIQRIVQAVNQNEDAQDEDVLVCLQLLQLAQSTDFEEGSRRHFISVLHILLTGVETPDDLVDACIKALQHAHEDQEAFLKDVEEIVSALSNAAQDNDDLQQVIQLRCMTILAATLEISTSCSSEFEKVILPSITSPHALVRESAVSCLGRLGIMTDKDTVVEEFKPILLQVASNPDETMEIRAQAIMGICDLSILFGNEMLSVDAEQDGKEEQDDDQVNDEHHQVDFISLLSDLICTSKPAVVSVASEVAAKLLISGKTNDSKLLADLVVTYFDDDLLPNDDDEEDMTELGSPLRMQQLLSVFFPAYSVKSAECRDTIVGAIGPTLTSVAQKSKKRSSKWNVARIVEYMTSILETGVQHDMDNKDDKNEEEEDKKDDDEETAQEEEEDVMLLVCIQVADFLLKQHDALSLKPTTFVRPLCKFIGGLNIDDETYPAALGTLKTKVDELGMSLSDSTALRSLEPLVELLEDVGDDHEESESTCTEDSDDGSLVEALKAIEISQGDSLPTVESGDDSPSTADSPMAKENEKTPTTTSKSAPAPQPSERRRRLRRLGSKENSVS